MIRSMIPVILKKYLKILVCMMLIATLGSSAMTALVSAKDSLNTSLNRYVKEDKIPDALINTQVANVNRLAAVREIDGVETANFRLYMTGTIRLEDGTYQNVRTISRGGDEFQLFYKWDEADPGDQDAVWIEYAFAKNKGIKAGDTISVRIHEEWRPLFVSALVTAPETLRSDISEEVSISTVSIGYLYIPMELLQKEENTEYQEKVAEWEEKKQELEEAKEQLSKAREAESALKEAESALGTARSELYTQREALFVQREKLVDQLGQLVGAKATGQYALNQLDELKSALYSLDEESIDYSDETISEALSILEEKGYSVSDLTTETINTVTDEISETGNSALREAAGGIRALVDGIYQIDMLLAEAESKVRQMPLYASYLESKKNEFNEALDEAWEQASQLVEDPGEKSLDSLESILNEAETQMDEAREKLDEFENIDLVCNQVQLRFTGDADRQETFDQAKEALEDVGIRYAALYEDSGIKGKIDSSVRMLGNLSKFVPLLLFAVTMMVSFLFMSLVVQQCRREIGILRALGFTSGKIRGIFCFVSLAVAAGSCLLALGFGWGLSVVIDRYLQSMFTLHSYWGSFNLALYAIASAITVGVILLSAWMGSSSINRVQPVEAMSRTVTEKASVPKFLQKWMRNAKPLTQFSIISLLQNKRRLIFSSICLASTVVLIFAALSFISSKNEMIEETFYRRLHYDGGGIFLGNVSDETLESLGQQEGVTDAQRALIYQTTVAFEGKETSVTFYAMDSSTDMITLYDADKKQLTFPETGIALEAHTAESMGVREGDTVTVDGVEMTVACLPKQCMDRTSYMSLTQAEALGDALASMAMFRAETAENVNEMRNWFSQQDGYIISIFIEESAQKVRDTYAMIELFIWIIIGAVCVTGILIVVNTSQNNLMQQKRELCVLRTLGIQQSQISGFWFLQSLLYFVIAGILGILAGEPVARMALEILSSSSSEFPFSGEAWPYALTHVLVFVFVVISHFLAMRLMKKWNILETVKDKE